MIINFQSVILYYCNFIRFNYNKIIMRILYCTFIIIDRYIEKKLGVSIIYIYIFFNNIILCIFKANQLMLINSFVRNTL